jgi:hypothetical protein
VALTSDHWMLPSGGWTCHSHNDRSWFSLYVPLRKNTTSVNYGGRQFYRSATWWKLLEICSDRILYTKSHRTRRDDGDCMYSSDDYLKAHIPYMVDIKWHAVPLRAVCRANGRPRTKINLGNESRWTLARNHFITIDYINDRARKRIPISCTPFL